MISIGDFVDYDAGNGLDRYEVVFIDNNEAQLANCCGANTFVSLSDLENSKVG